MNYAVRDPRRSPSRPKNAAQILEGLVALSGDAAVGYRRAARVMVDPDVRALLEKNALEREEIASVLSAKLVELGHEPPREHVAAGSSSPDDPAHVLDACASGERETLAQFSFALGQALPDDVHHVVQSQLGRVLSACAALQRVRHDVAEQRRRAGFAR